MKKLVLIDAMSVLHRAYHAYPLSLRTADGELTNAVYGFSSILLNLIEKTQPTHVAVAWDVGKPTFRHTAYEKYKEHRQKPDQEMLDQIDRTKEVVDTLNIPQFGVEGFEADDLVGTLSRLAAEEKDGLPAGMQAQVQVVILTGDRDALQLVEGIKVIVWMPPAGGYGNRASNGPVIYDEEGVELKYGLKPKQIIDLKGLMGDASDEIPGVKGIGQVTATKLLQKFGSVEAIYEAVDKHPEEVEAIVRRKGLDLLIGGREMAKLSKELATIHREVPIKLSWDKCKLSDYDREKVLELFEKLQFRSLIKKLPKDEWEKELGEVFLK